MAWYTIAEGTTIGEFEASAVVEEVPSGTELRLDIDTRPFPIAPLADLWGMEWVFDKMLNVGAEVTEVKSDGWYKIEVYMTATSPLLPILWAIAAILIGAGILIFSIKLSAKEGGLAIGDIVKWGAIGILAVLGIKAISAFKEVRT